MPGYRRSGASGGRLCSKADNLKDLIRLLKKTKADVGIGFDGAIYSLACILEVVAGGRKALSAHLATIPSRPSTPETEVECADNKKFGLIKKAVKYFQDEGFDVVTLDGARIEFPDGWGLLRASNTSPKLVMRVEADTPKRVKEIRKLIEDKVKELNR